MHEVNEIGHVIATRHLVFVGDDGSKEDVFVKIGKPYEINDQKDCCCPYEILSKSHNKLYGMIGIDTVQALELTLKTIKPELEYLERKNKGKLHFLDEEGHCFT